MHLFLKSHLYLLLLVSAGAFHGVSKMKRPVTVRVPTSFLASKKEEEPVPSETWLTCEDLEKLSEELKIPHEKITALHADVTSYNSDCKPEAFRINQYSNLLNQEVELGQRSHSIKSSNLSPEDIYEIQEAAERNLRWCSDFVKVLNLCPWAKLSLKCKNGIRIKIIPQSVGLDGMEEVIRESAKELVHLTDDNVVDINAGITFVAALPNNAQRGHNKDFQFEEFYDFCTDLEDRLFDEADEAQDAIEAGNSSATDDILIGDEVTIAPFHPQWYFSSKDDTVGENPLNYEKKSPYPTISLVRTSVIVEAGEESTSRIGIHNEEILNEHGAKKLGDLYDNIYQDNNIK